MYLDTDVVVLRDPLAPVYVQTSYDIQVKLHYLRVGLRRTSSSGSGQGGSIAVLSRSLCSVRAQV